MFSQKKKSQHLEVRKEKNVSKIAVVCHDSFTSVGVGSTKRRSGSQMSDKICASSQITISSIRIRCCCNHKPETFIVIIHSIKNADYNGSAKTRSLHPNRAKPVSFRHRISSTHFRFPPALHSLHTQFKVRRALCISLSLILCFSSFYFLAIITLVLSGFIIIELIINSSLAILIEFSALCPKIHVHVAL